MNYARLSDVMINSISMDDLLAICAELQVPSSDLHLSNNPSQKEIVLTLSDHLHEQGRFDELFNALNRLYPKIVQAWLQEYPVKKWVLPLVGMPKHLLEKISSLLGEEGELYFGGEAYDEPTGCFCWPFVSPIARGMFPELKYRFLERVRAHLQVDPVIAYVGEIVYSDSKFPEVPCIVIAPTTNQFDIIRIAYTCGPMLDVYYEEIIDELMVIDELHGIDILSATDRTISFRLRRQVEGIERDRIKQWLTIFPDMAIWPGDFAQEKHIKLIFE